MAARKTTAKAKTTKKSAKKSAAKQKANPAKKPLERPDATEAVDSVFAATKGEIARLLGVKPGQQKAFDRAWEKSKTTKSRAELDRAVRGKRAEGVQGFASSPDQLRELVEIIG